MFQYWVISILLFTQKHNFLMTMWLYIKSLKVNVGKLQSTLLTRKKLKSSLVSPKDHVRIKGSPFSMVPKKCKCQLSEMSKFLSIRKHPKLRSTLMFSVKTIQLTDTEENCWALSEDLSETMFMLLLTWSDISLSNRRFLF